MHTEQKATFRCLVMATGYQPQSRFAQALQNQQNQEPCSCPYPDHGGRIFQDFQQFLNHAKIEHPSDFEGLNTQQSRAKFREVSKDFSVHTLVSLVFNNVTRSNYSSVAKAGDRSASDIGGLILNSEKEAPRTSPTSREERSASTEHDFTGRKDQAPSHVKVADPDYSRHIPSLYQTTPEPSNGRSTNAMRSSRLASQQPQSSESQSQQPVPKSQQSQGQLGVVIPPHIDLRYPDLIFHPGNRLISQEELASEVKTIYEGLVMVENKCIHVDRAAIAEEGEARTNLASDHWQALIALHRTLLHEHHDFFLASQHPSSPPALRRLVGKYSIPMRMWNHGIYSFLELLRRRLPESKDYMLAFVYLAYQMVALLYEVVPAFEDTLIECLGDLGRYRMVIEDEDVRDRETWAGVARSWYVKAADKNPTVGRLYHHLAILARPRVLLQMYYYSRSLASVEPFQGARESIETLLDPLVEKSQHTPLDDLSTEEVFALAHASQFDHSSIEKDSFGINKPTAKFSAPKAKFLEKLDIYVGRVTAKWKDQGVYVAVANIAGWFDYGEDKNLIRHALLQQFYPPPPSDSSNEDDVNARDNQKTAPPSDQQEPEKEKDRIPVTPEEWEQAQERIENNCHLNNARLLTYETSALVFRRLSDKNVLPHVHVMLAFLYNIASSTYVSYLIADAPWVELVAFLNSLIKTEIRHSQSGNRKHVDILLATDVFPGEGERTDELPLPEDYHIRGQIWAWHFPEKWLEREQDEEERYLELASTAKNRVVRILRLAFQIAKASLSYSFLLRWLV
ncbi:telomerase-binding est1a [Pyrenophora seminiperda CCB06]|uniref:Telomerase-binding est1a n=1 Tax=Pyrenophora seminiperda CCB06 TaxID=1302712 RepID=A0A3M7MIB6_9PLEO|nr:telomerase-binding est1a [Pyrenophora seminiperda CCB06]